MVGWRGSWRMVQQIRPSTAEELREIVASAAADETPLELLGAGTKRGYGRPVEAQTQVALDALCGIGMYEPAELVMSAQVGTPLAEIEARLADNQQQLAFEPPDYGALLGAEPGRGTIGGVIACNLSGPRRIKVGAARDHFLGVRAVTGRGDSIKSGGRVVKNVTGYDLCKLFAGSFGTLVAMTEVTFKVLPAAEHEATLLLRARTRGAGFAALRRAMNSAGDVAGAACLPAAAAARSSVPAIAAGGADLAALRLEGPAPSVHARVAGLKALLAGEGELDELTPAASAALWREIRDVTLLPAGGPLWRVSVPPAAGAPVLEMLERELRLAWLADWAGGLLWLAVDDADDAGAAAIREAVLPAGGHATLVRASAGLRAALPVFQPQEPALARLSARVKDSFDPKRILNRGRMYTEV
jgi:glycolate oxidase FAD binding subunit